MDLVLLAIISPSQSQSCIVFPRARDEGGGWVLLSSNGQVKDAKLASIGGAFTRSCNDGSALIERAGGQREKHNVGNLVQGIII